MTEPERPQLYWVYDAGFRWGKPDFIWPHFPASVPFPEANRMIKNQGCGLRGCYICNPRPEQAP